MVFPPPFQAFPTQSHILSNITKKRWNNCKNSKTVLWAYPSNEFRLVVAQLKQVNETWDLAD